MVNAFTLKKNTIMKKEEMCIKKNNDLIALHYKSGIVRLRVINTRLGELEHLQVPIEKRRNGIGRFLLREIEKIAKEKGLKKLSLLCSSDNEVAIQLYIKECYVEEAKLKNHFRKGLDSFIFSKFI